MAIVYVSLGSNIDREGNLRAALAALREQFHDLRLSPVYESAAVGFDGAPFYNLVAEARTELTPAEVVRALRAIEDSRHRDRSQPKFSSRTLDLDLLLYDERIAQEAGFQLPRAEIAKYAFVLGPLADLVPDRLHPTLKQTFAQLWRQLPADKRESLRRIDLAF